MTTTDILDELTGTQWEIADSVEDALKAAGRDGLTPSLTARKVRASYSDAIAVLRYLVRHHYAHTSGNGARTRYHAGRA